MSLLDRDEWGRMVSTENQPWKYGGQIMISVTLLWYIYPRGTRQYQQILHPSLLINCPAMLASYPSRIHLHSHLSSRHTVQNPTHWNKHYWKGNWGRFSHICRSIPKVFTMQSVLLPRDYVHSQCSQEGGDTAAEICIITQSRMTQRHPGLCCEHLRKMCGNNPALLKLT